ncbi:MAG: ammonium transporter [Anaerolineae bacterium]|nr:ammonium transporter [Anaerolineae bacterium]MDW8172308.1 ammonium transporter [Anaerolineae bacterium]
MKFHNSRARLRARFFAIAIAALVMAIAGFGIRAQDAEATPTPEASEATTETTTEAAVEEEPLTLATDVEGTLTVDARLDTTWIVLTGILVFFMQAGFAVLEAGLIRQKGVVNALVENFMDAGLTAIVFWAVGFGIAFGADASGLIGTDNFFLAKAIVVENGAISFPSMAFATNGQVAYPNLTVLAFFFFQFAFAATASTIATGAMAERTDFVGDLIYTALMGAFLYPIIVHWVWGGGWLGANSFHDFAGSTVVHAVGGFTALIGAWMLGPRPNREFGKFPPAHNLGLATLGTMILWFGWYGFNPGSTLGFGSPGLVGLVLVNTTLAAAAGTLAAMFLVYSRTGKWDLTFTLNGSLAGLVAITAGCAFVMPWAAVVIGAIGGILVYLSVEAVEALKVDDPVGAFSVHGACGVWGTLAIGLFGAPELMFGYFAGKGGLLMGGGLESLITQFIGVASVTGAVTVGAMLMFGLLKAINRLRVEKIADQIGIDAYEHGVSVWPDVLPMPSISYVEDSGRRAAAD